VRAGGGGDFSAVGYFFGREMHEQLGVPIGLIDNSWGGSSCEAWIQRERMENDPNYASLLKRWDNWINDFDETKWKADWAQWRKKAAAAKAVGQPPPRKRPASLFGYVLQEIVSNAPYLDADFHE